MRIRLLFLGACRDRQTLGARLAEHVDELHDLAVGRLYAGTNPGAALRSAVYRYARYVGLVVGYGGLRWWALGGAAAPPIVFLTNPLGQLGTLERWVAAFNAWNVMCRLWP